MKIAYSTRKFYYVTTKPTKLEQTTERPTIQLLAKNNFTFQVRPGLKPQTLGCNGDYVTFKPSGNEPGSC